MEQTDKTLEELENDYWDKPEFESYVTTTCYSARKKPLSDLSNEEVRLLIGQKISLKYILPLAVDILKLDPLIEVTFYPGDLLKVMLELNIEDWKDNKEERDSLLKILFNNSSDIESSTDIPENTKIVIRKMISSIKEKNFSIPK